MGGLAEVAGTDGGLGSLVTPGGLRAGGTTGDEDADTLVATVLIRPLKMDNSSFGFGSVEGVKMSLLRTTVGFAVLYACSAFWRSR